MKKIGENNREEQRGMNGTLKSLLFTAEYEKS